MAQKVLLTRHGQIYDNVLLKLTGHVSDDKREDIVLMKHLEAAYLKPYGRTLEEFNREARSNFCPSNEVPGIQMLTPYGEYQATVLGEYLALNKLDGKNAIFATSQLFRTYQTAQRVAAALRLKLDRNNARESHKFNEQVPLEFIEWGYKEAKLPVPINSEMTYPPEEYLGMTAHQALTDILSENPDQDVVAVLHGHIITCLLRYIKKDCIKIDKMIDNCGLVTFQNTEAGFKIAGKYMPFSKIEETVNVAKTGTDN